MHYFLLITFYDSVSIEMKFQGRFFSWRKINSSLICSNKRALLGNLSWQYWHFIVLFGVGMFIFVGDCDDVDTDVTFVTLSSFSIWTFAFKSIFARILCLWFKCSTNSLLQSHVTLQVWPKKNKIYKTSLKNPFRKMTADIECIKMEKWTFFVKTSKPKYLI